MSENEKLALFRDLENIRKDTELLFNVSIMYYISKLEKPDILIKVTGRDIKQALTFILSNYGENMEIETTTKKYVVLRYRLGKN